MELERYIDIRLPPDELRILANELVYCEDWLREKGYILKNNGVQFFLDVRRYNTEGLAELHRKFFRDISSVKAYIEGLIDSSLIIYPNFLSK